MNHRIIMRIVHEDHVYIEQVFHNLEIFHQITRREKKTKTEETIVVFFFFRIIITQIIKLKNRSKYFAHKQHAILLFDLTDHNCVTNVKY